MMKAYRQSGVLTAQEFADDAARVGFSSGFGSFAAAVQEGFLDSPTTGPAVQEYFTPESGTPLTEDEYKQSPHYRQQIPWSEGLTDDRAAYIANWYDAREVRRRRLANSGDTAAQLAGYIVGSVPDVTNFIPFVGVAGKAAQGAGLAAKSHRLAAAGKAMSAAQTTIKGRALAGAADAALGAGVVLTATADYRAEFGADVSAGAILAEVAGAAFIGAAFGGIAGGLSKARQAALKRRYGKDSLSALEDAVAGLIEDGEVRLSPEIGKLVDATARKENPLFSPDLFSRTVETEAAVRAPGARTGALGEFEDFIRGQVLAKDKKLSTEFEAARQKYEAAEAALAEIEGPLAARTDADAVSLIDEATGERLRAIEQDLANSPPKAVRDDLVAEKDLLLDNIGRDAIARAENDFRIGPTKKLKAAQKKLAAERKAFAAVQRKANAAARAELEINKAAYRPRVDVTPPPEQPAAARVREAEAPLGAKPADADILKSEYGIDTADRTHADVVRGLRERGELSAEDARTLEQVEEIETRTAAYADAIVAAAQCEITR